MQFITHQSCKKLPSVPLPSICSSFFSSIHLLVLFPPLAAVSTNIRSLSSLHGDFLFLTSPRSLSLSLVVGAGRGDSSAAFPPAPLLSGGDVNGGGNQGWRSARGGREGRGEMECSSTTAAAASDCVKQSSCAAEGLTRDTVVHPLLLCASSPTHFHGWMGVCGRYLCDTLPVACEHI